MDEQHIVSILIVVFSISEPVRSISSSHKSFLESHRPFATYNVSLFMNTTERIWTLNSTQNSSVWCRNDEVANTTSNKVYFNRSFIDGGGRWVIQEYEGELVNVIPSIMLVGLQGTDASTIEQLVYASAAYDCGVFSVLKLNVPLGFPAEEWYDLRVRNSSISNFTQKCKDQFNTAVKQKPTITIYNDTCQSL
uniref:Putative group i salivary lipocalin n=1 Tax=Rhipicephalus pulchellus TaxID=72859 RepID=L7LR91_RHIPC